MIIACKSGDLSRLTSNGLRGTLWVVQALLSLTLVGGAIWKLVTPIPQLAARMPWMGQVSPALLHTTAIADLLCGLGVLLPSITRIRPWLSVPAAWGCVVLMAAAIVFHVSRGEASKTPFNILLAALAVAVAWGRGSWAAVPPRRLPPTRD